MRFTSALLVLSFTLSMEFEVPNDTPLDRVCSAAFAEANLSFEDKERLLLDLLDVLPSQGRLRNLEDLLCIRFSHDHVRDYWWHPNSRDALKSKLLDAWAEFLAYAPIDEMDEAAARTFDEIRDMFRASLTSGQERLLGMIEGDLLNERFRNSDEDSVLEALTNRSFDIALKILKHGTLQHFNGNKVLKTACSVGASNVVRELLKNPTIDPMAYDNEPFIIAATSGNKAVAQAFFDCPRFAPASVIGFLQENGFSEILDLYMNEGDQSSSRSPSKTSSSSEEDSSEFDLFA